MNRKNKSKPPMPRSIGWTAMDHETLLRELEGLYRFEGLLAAPFEDDDARYQQLKQWWRKGRVPVALRPQ